MASYADLALLKAALAIGTTESDTLLQLALDAATTFIDQYTGRSFAGEAGATKYFVATDPNTLTLSPDIRVVTSVATDDRGDLSFSTTLASTDYRLLPLQSFPDAGIYSRLHIAGNSSKSFGCGQQVKVIGDWGYVVGGAAPEAIQQACLIQAGRIFKRREAPFGILQQTDLGTYARISAADPDVVALLDPYKVTTKSPGWVIV